MARRKEKKKRVHFVSKPDVSEYLTSREVLEVRYSPEYLYPLMTSVWTSVRVRVLNVWTSAYACGRMRVLASLLLIRVQ